MTAASDWRDRLAGAKQGALVGLLAGIVLALLGEGGAAIIRSRALMADVGIAGFTAVFGLPASVALGALLGWWGRPHRTTGLALGAAVPAGLVAITHMVLQTLAN